METQVLVTLTALNGDIYPAERVLSLIPDRPTISIGRASKSINKGIVGARDNAWFDSPVMSRHHAKLSLNIEDNTVEITDIGSMHGTFLNNAGLTQHQPTIINDSDIVVFGARVTRGAESISACAFRITLEYSSYKGKNETLTFACPDSSDVDEEFDSDDHGAEEPSSDDGVSIGSPESKVPQHINAIDLTGDDNPTELSASKDITTIKSLDDAPLDYDVSLVPMAIVLDSDEEVDIAPSNFEYHSDETDSDDRGSLYDYPSDSPSTKVQDGEVDTRPDECTSESAHHSSPRPLIRDHLVGNTGETCGGKDIQNAESNMSDYGSESDLDLSDAGIEGINAFYGLSEATSGDLYDKANSEGGMTSDSLMLEKDHEKTCELNDEFLDSPTCTCQATEEALSASMNIECVAMSPVDQSLLSARQPSPSDAAMMKTTTSQTPKPMPMHYLPSNDWKELTTRCLQGKVSRHANLETRTGYVTLSPPREKPLFSPYLKTNPVYSAALADSEKLEANAPDEISIDRPEPQVVASERILVSHRGETSRSTTPPVPYNENQDQAPVMDTPPSSFLDMTSAVRYNESKALMTGAITDTTYQSGRSKLRIDDIIDNSTTPWPKNLKRKVDEISNVIESEVRAWTSSPPVNQTNNTLDIIASRSDAPTQPAPSSTEQEPESGTPGQRSKRLKKVMEGAAYIALGGVGLFSILVATAPDYL